MQEGKQKLRKERGSEKGKRKIAQMCYKKTKKRDKKKKLTNNHYSSFYYKD
jgi:hypothetical protein